MRQLLKFQGISELYLIYLCKYVPEMMNGSIFFKRRINFESRFSTTTSTLSEPRPVTFVYVTDSSITSVSRRRIKFDTKRCPHILSLSFHFRHSIYGRFYFYLHSSPYPLFLYNVRRISQ